MKVERASERKHDDDNDNRVAARLNSGCFEWIKKIKSGVCEAVVVMVKLAVGRRVWPRHVQFVWAAHSESCW